MFFINYGYYSFVGWRVSKDLPPICSPPFCFNDSIFCIRSFSVSCGPIYQMLILEPETFLLCLRSCLLKVWSWDERMDHLETAAPRDPSHNQPPNTDNIAYTSKILLKEPWYSCLLWGYAGAWQTQKLMLTVSYWMEYRAPNGRARESTQELKGSANL